MHNLPSKCRSLHHLHLGGFFMIQRIALHTDLDHIKHYFDVQHIEQPHQSKFNISPTNNVTIIMNNRQHTKVIDQARWGLFPYWAPNSVNTTVKEMLHKDYISNLARRNRCIMPCTGFYGQKQFDVEKEKRAMHIVNPGQTMFGIAAVYDTIVNSNREEIKIFTILTEEMTGPLSTWQARTPVIVHPDGINAWLDRGNRELEPLLSHLISLDSNNLRSYPVTNQINDDYFDTPDCVKEVNIGLNVAID